MNVLLRTLLVGLSLLSAVSQLYAGHGMMNAFNDVAPLPAAGVTPDQPHYVIDRLNERARLATASPAQQIELGLLFAAEKLAELDAMVRAGNKTAAREAADAYAQYLDCVAGALAKLPAMASVGAAKHYAQALLTQRYLIALDYLDLPAGARPVILAAVESASKEYERVMTTLPAAYKSAQFFKEEELRWSWEMARQADIQGL